MPDDDTQPMDANTPPAPTAPGYYVLVNGAWKLTDGLTYRTFANTLHVR